MFCIAGLGNPGKKYRGSRHNVGWLILDALAGEGGWQEEKYAHALIKSGEIAGEPVVFAKPQTFMNKSGETLHYFQEKKGIAPEHMIVIHDDADLPLGTVKISKEKGSGGHKGVKSIIRSLGTNAFVRIRIGIREKPGAVSRLLGMRRRAGDIVLKSFEQSETETLRGRVLPRVKKALTLIIEDGVQAAMNAVHTTEP